MNQSQSQGPVVSKPKKSNMALIIILVVVFGLLILGVAGYFGWKYLGAKYFKSSAGPGSTTQKSGAFSLTQLEEMLKYPNGIIISTDHSKSVGYTSVMLTQTADSITAANNYYLNLNSASKWTVTAKSFEADGSRADITYEGTKDKFTVYLIIDNNGEKTEILARIDGEALPIGTPLGGTGSSAVSASSAPSPVTTSSSNASGTKAAISTDYVIADSATRVITESELTNLSAWQLKVARNEIYARHGREFVHKDLQCYFATKSWYVKDESFTESVFSTIETKNIATIQAYEQKISSPLQSTDSGC